MYFKTFLYVTCNYIEETGNQSRKAVKCLGIFNPPASINLVLSGYFFKMRNKTLLVQIEFEKHATEPKLPCRVIPNQTKFACLVTKTNYNNLNCYQNAFCITMYHGANVNSVQEIRQKARVKQRSACFSFLP